MGMSRGKSLRASGCWSEDASGCFVLVLTDSLLDDPWRNELMMIQASTRLRVRYTEYRTSYPKHSQTREIQRRAAGGVRATEAAGTVVVAATRSTIQITLPMTHMKSRFW